MKKVAVLIPCYNEEKTIGKVVSDFREYLPQATIYVYDNNSTDKITEEARKAGAIVINEFLKTGFITHVPLAILATGLVLTGLIIAFSGLVIHTISRRFQSLDYQLRNYFNKLKK